MESNEINSRPRLCPRSWNALSFCLSLSHTLWHLGRVIGLDSRSLKKKDYKWTLFGNSHVEKLLVLQPVVPIAGSWRSADSLGPISVFQWGKEWDRKWTEKKWLVKTKDSRAEKRPFIYAIFLWFCHVGLYIVFYYHKYNADLVKWQRLKVLVSISFF